MRVTRSTRVARLMRMTRVDLDTLVTMATLVTDQGDLREEFVINWPNLVWFPNWPTHLLLMKSCVLDEGLLIFSR